MEALQTLGTALGLTMLAGVNLYLTVFMTGLAIQMGWVTLSPSLAGLETLADPIVLVVSGVLLLVEFLIDKCPYADNCWDTIHTIIRPIGGEILALKAIGTVDPAIEIVAVLLGGSIAFTAHSAKSGTRLLVNSSTEPASNIALSFGEDLLVAGGTWFAFQHPILSLVIVTIFVVGFWFFAPRLYRMMKAQFIGIFHRFLSRRPPAPHHIVTPQHLPSFAAESWLDLQNGNEQLVWSLPCFSFKMKAIGRHVRGCLLATSEGRMFFIGRKNFRASIREIPLDEIHVWDTPGPVFHRVSFKLGDGEPVSIRVTRKYASYVPKVMDWLRNPSGITQTEIAEPRAKSLV